MGAIETIKTAAPTVIDMKGIDMKALVVLMALLAFGTLAFARGGGGGHSSGGHGSSSSYSSGGSTGSHSTSGYVKSNGTYVAPSHATNPNGSKADNWSTKGNVNPYTGKLGTKPQD
jgi:hypothetical protein